MVILVSAGVPLLVLLGLARLRIDTAFAAAVCYVAGAAAGNLLPIPPAAADLLQTLSSLTVAFWIPLLIIPLHPRATARSLLSSLATALIVAAAILLSGFGVFALFRSSGRLRPELGALAAALFFGGAPAADQIRQALHIPSAAAAGVQSVGSALTAAFVTLMLFLTPILSLRRPKDTGRTTTQPAGDRFSSILITVGSSALIVGLGLAAGSLFPAGLASVVGMAAVGLLSVGTSILPRLRRESGIVFALAVRSKALDTPPSVSPGEYVALMFAFTAGSVTNLRWLLSAAPVGSEAAGPQLWLAGALLLSVAAAVSVAAARALRPLRSGATVTVTALLASAPFAGPAAAAAGEPATAPGALAAGLAGYALGGTLGRLLLLLLTLQS